MNMRVKLDNRQLRSVIRNVDQIGQIVEKSATDVEATAKRSILIRQSRSDVGKEVTRGVMRRGKIRRKVMMHYPSKPGYPPNNDTGMLANSIGSRMISKTTAEIYASAEYAIGLEIGTSKVRARPFLVPALERIRPSFTKAITKALGA